MSMFEPGGGIPPIINLTGEKGPAVKPIPTRRRNVGDIIGKLFRDQPALKYGVDEFGQIVPTEDSLQARADYTEGLGDAS